MLRFPHIQPVGPDLLKVHSRSCPCGSTGKAWTTRGKPRRIPCPHAILLGRARWRALGCPRDREEVIAAITAQAEERAAANQRTEI